MYCERCHKKPATVFMTQIVNGQATRQYLCADCASRFCIEGGVSLEDIFNRFIAAHRRRQRDNGEEEVKYERVVNQINPFGKKKNSSALNDLVCPACGTTYREFRKTGRLGCAQCADIMKEQIQEVFFGESESLCYQGRAPKKLREKIYGDREKEVLQKMLKDAVDKEDYSRAAVIRDRIHAIDRGDTHEMV
ncbi:MAG: UvrB/UvrC motif-containing protein [Clostridiales bacterium]|nr:UvrB/UvrC motif-containing protein [Clostridiales bacterium]